jgi:hypothetical protein
MSTRPKTPRAVARVLPGHNEPVTASVRLEDLLARLLPAAAPPAPAGKSAKPARSTKTGPGRRAASPAPASAPPPLAELLTVLRAAREAQGAARAAPPARRTKRPAG